MKEASGWRVGDMGRQRLSLSLTKSTHGLRRRWPFPMPQNAVGGAVGDGHVAQLATLRELLELKAQKKALR